MDVERSSSLTGGSWGAAAKNSGCWYYLESTGIPACRALKNADFFGDPDLSTFRRLTNSREKLFVDIIPKEMNCDCADQFNTKVRTIICAWAISFCFPRQFTEPADAFVFP
jgi:hypothetical protein